MAVKMDRMRNRRRSRKLLDEVIIPASCGRCWEDMHISIVVIIAIKQMHLSLNSTGTLSLKEGDAGLFFTYPEIPGMSKLLQVFPLLGASKGADMYFGRKLLSHALAAGFEAENIELEISGQIQYKPKEKEGMARGMPSIFEDVLRNPGQLQAVEFSKEDVDLIRRGLEEWAECKEGIVAFPSVVVVCKKN